ncbi:hypothetical protein NDN16_15585 [Aureimonas altamirensis]|uniref:hypothetical protein n=1 Tax=Aureimonas altamirensis TaxID=370622 RepID=UPI0020366B98|nr:hypothetical protein [Aureimonas altamirensis]MCM2505092.1 hypothetical protein [Aureimonas altamirensis]
MRDVNVDTDLKPEDAPLPQDAAPPPEVEDLGARLRALITEDLMARMKESGFDEVGGIGHLIEMERYAASDPAGYLRLVARHAAGHGVDIGSVLREAASAGGDEADARAAVMRRIEAFRDAADEAGAPRHPHYEAVSGEMASLIRADPSLDLAEAYRHAVWMNPEVRETLIEAELADRQAKLHADGTQKARRAASDAALAARQNIRPGGGGFARTPDVRNLDDAIAIALRQVNA